MGILSRLLGTGDTDTDADADPDSEDRETRYGIHVAALHYEDGTTEEVEFLQCTRSDTGYAYKNEVRPSPAVDDVWTTGGVFVPFSVLSRKPDHRRVGTCVVEYSYDPAEANPRMFESGVTIENVRRDYDDPGDA